VYVLENPSPRQSLQGFISEQTAGDNVLKLTNERNVSRDGLSGKAFLTTGPGDGMVQFFASEDRLYRFLSFGASPEDARLTRFFSSITFGKTRDAVAAEEGPGLPFEQVFQPGSADEELAQKAFTGKQVTMKVLLAMKPEPSYTDAARQSAIAGTVVLRCIFRSSGIVDNIRIVSGLPHGLTERAVEAAKRIKFIPARKDGKYVSMWMQLEYNFNLY